MMLLVLLLLCMLCSMRRVVFTLMHAFVLCDGLCYSHACFMYYVKVMLLLCLLMCYVEGCVYYYACLSVIMRDYVTPMHAYVLCWGMCSLVCMPLCYVMGYVAPMHFLCAMLRLCYSYACLCAMWRVMLLFCMSKCYVMSCVHSYACLCVVW